MTTNLAPLVDFDYFVYADGAVADSQAKQELGIDKDWVKEHGPEALKERLDAHDYLHYALANVKHSYLKILERFPDRPYERLFIGGPTNYRDSLGTLKTYKGQRKKSSRPKYYKEIREYLINKHGAELSDGREADDDVSCIQFAHPDKSTVIVSVDKDLKNTPGWAYSPKKQELIYVTKKEADLNWLGQVATGDSCDNIGGIHLFGEKGLDKLRLKCKDDISLMRKEIEALYKKQYGKEWEHAFHETATLVWIQRKDWINYDGSKIEKPATNEVTPE